MKLVSSRLARTMEELAEFSLNILYITGHLSSAADALSRLKGGIPIPEIGDQYLSPAGQVIKGQPAAGVGIRFLSV